ncbi:hypothetical protein [Actinoplanes sp. NPDC049599]|uniref:hypothetical protein n=1 Tax=Actinoplanes sp. NPDC049599 TaxID=3363903 RepID=UPI0037BAF880
MSQSDDLPPPRRPLFFPVVIATVLLSIIAMSAGLVLGSRYEAPEQAGDETGYVPPQPTNSPVGCPEEMHDTARRLGYDLALTQVLRVRAASTGTTVWICSDRTGRLFYQAKRGGEGQPWVEGETALFLADVVKGDDDYHATAADGNTFSVNSERLEVVIKGKKQTTEVTPE